MSKMQENFIEKIDLRIKQFNNLKEDKNIYKAIDLIERGLKKGEKILIFGNGGSSTQASHFAAELVNKFYLDRAGIPAIALTDNIANITSIANDRDFKYVFSRQIEALGKEDDIAIGISTSGKSENVLEAINAAKRLNLRTIMLCGEHSKQLEKQGIDIIISVNSSDTPIIQELHLFILHMIAEILEKRLVSGNIR